MQACDAHIVQALCDLHALAVPDGRGGHRWCLLDDQTRGDALETLLLTCMEHGLPFDNFDAWDLLQRLQGSGDEFSCALGDGE